MNKKYITWEAASIAASTALENIHPHLAFDSPVYIHGVPRGGVPAMFLVKEILQQRYGLTSRIVEDAGEADLIVDDIVDSGETKSKMKSLNPTAIFISLFEKKDEWLVFPWEKEDEADGPEENIRRLLEFTGDDVNREGLIETPKRVLKAFSKIFGGYDKDPKDVMKTFTEGACDNMVLLKDIELYSTCEHHMLPFFGRCHIAYIPNGKVIGVSKLARLMEIFARRLQIQERIGQQITEALQQYLEPLGAACIIEAQHFCMTSRGVEKQNSVMVTSSLTGEFAKPEVRQELLSLIRR